MKTGAIFSACAASAAMFALGYGDSPTTRRNARSQAGIPVKTRLREGDSFDSSS